MTHTPLRISHPNDLQRLAKHIQGRLDNMAVGMGFVLLIFPMEDGTKAGDVVSNCRMEDLPAILSEAVRTLHTEGGTNAHRS